MGNAVVTFDQVHVLAPRGRFEVEMYLSSLKLTGQVRRPFQDTCAASVRTKSAACIHLSILSQGSLRSSHDLTGSHHVFCVLCGRA